MLLGFLRVGTNLLITSWKDLLKSGLLTGAEQKNEKKVISDGMKIGTEPKNHYFKRNENW